MAGGIRARLGLFGDLEFVALSGTAFARAQAYSTVLIALALYADQFGTTGTIEGLFATSFAIVQLLIVVPLGRAIDTGNAKRFLLLGLRKIEAKASCFSAGMKPTGGNHPTLIATAGYST